MEGGTGYSCHPQTMTAQTTTRIIINYYLGKKMYTVVLDKNWVRNFNVSIGYPIGPPSKLYQDNQSTNKRVFMDIITPQHRPLYFMITAIHEIYLRKKINGRYKI